MPAQIEQVPSVACCRCGNIYPRTSEFFMSGGKRQSFPTTLCKNCRNQAEYLKKKAARLKALQHYSGSVVPFCQCCSESAVEFLTFDHINGGGNQHRKQLHREDIVRYLTKANFPSGFRVLCQNCNSSLGFHGYCPHQTPLDQRTRKKQT